MKETFDCEVLVLGAGPTGVMSARSIELFASLSLVENLFEHGTINSSIDFFIVCQRVAS